MRGGRQALLDALLGLAQALAAQHRFGDARAVLTVSVGTRPGRTAPLAALARVMATEGDLEAAEAAYRRLVVLEPDRLAHRLALGRVLERGADLAGAAALYEAVARERPQVAAPLLALGSLALAFGDAAKAREHHLRALTLDPEHVEARLGLADAEAALDDPGAARRWLAEALALAPSTPKVWLRRARLLEEAGSAEEARLALLEARSAMPHRQEPRLWLIAFGLREGDVTMALDEAEAARAAHPRSLPAALAATDALLAAARHEEARELLAPLGDNFPEHREVQRRVARLEARDGEVGRARRRWWRIARLDPRIHGPVDPLERLDRHPLPPAAGEVRVFLVVRNEKTRLPGSSTTTGGSARTASSCSTTRRTTAPPSGCATRGRTFTSSIPAGPTAAPRPASAGCTGCSTSTAAALGC
jgi:tetratricopeptide (TPR) repeat protein